MPPGTLDVLEIGSNPYFTTYLLRTFRPEARLTLANKVGDEDVKYHSQSVTYLDLDGKEQMDVYEAANINIETDPDPFEAERFDTVLFCEVIEHLTIDPLHALLSIKRMLRPNGQLILTTPNVARLENVARMIVGANIYDPYSGHGAYGRHNREYSRHELHQLLQYCGFTAEVSFTGDVHENRAGNFLNRTRWSRF